MERFEKCAACHRALTASWAESQNFDPTPMRCAWLVHMKLHYEMVAQVENKYNTKVVHPAEVHDPFYYVEV